MRNFVALLFLLGLVFSAFGQENSVELNVEKEDLVKLEKVIVVFKTHFDIGFTGLESEVVERYRTTMIDKALKTIKKSNRLSAEKQFSWTVPGWPLARILDDWSGQKQKRRDLIEKALVANRLTLHALPFTLQTEAASAEMIARSLSISRDIALEYGIAPPRAAKMTDVPSHSWILPTVLKAGGIEFLHLGCNPASQSPEVPMLFNWEGPDGSQLLTMYVSGNYGTGVVPPVDWPHKTWLAMVMTGDNHGPPTTAEVKSIITEAKLKLPGDVELVFGSLEDFSDAIAKENVSIPVVRGDMPDSWIHGFMTSPVESGLYLHGIRQLEAAEQLLAFSILEQGRDSFSNVDPSQLKTGNPLIPETNLTFTDLIDSGYDEALRYAEHTWALNTNFMYPRLYGGKWKKAVAKGTYSRYEESWSEKGNYAHRVDDISERIIDSCYQSLEKQESPLSLSLFSSLISTIIKADQGEPQHLELSKDDYSRLKANGYSSLKSVDDFLSGSDIVELKLANSENQDQPLSAVLRSFGGTIDLLLASNEIEPLTLLNYEIVEAKSIPVSYMKKESLENRYLKLEIDQQNSGLKKITRLADQEVISDSDAFGSFIYEQYGTNEVDRYLDAYLKITPPWAYNDMGKRNMPTTAYQQISSLTEFVGVINHSLYSEALFKSKLANRYGDVLLRITLCKDSHHIDFSWMINNKKADPIPEAGWLYFPFKAIKWSWTMGRAGSYIDPEKDIVNNCFKDLLAVHNGVSIKAKKFKAAVIPHDSLLVSPGREGIYRFSDDVSMDQPDLYVNLFNTQWGTNYRQWISGTIQSSVSIVIEPAEDYSQTSEQFLDQNAQLCLKSPLATIRKIPVIENRKAQSLLSSDTNHIILSQARWNNSEQLQIRLWETIGQDDSVTIKLHTLLEGCQVFQSDLFGQIGEPLLVINGQFNYQAKAYQPMTFIIQLEP